MTDQQPRVQQQSQQKHGLTTRPDKTKRSTVGAVTVAVMETTSPYLSTASTANKCPACDKTRHSIQRCAFLELTPERQRELINKARFCFNCLHPGHKVRDYQSRGSCRTCRSSQHHSLLHLNPSTTPADSPTPQSGGESLVTYGDSEGEPAVLSAAKFCAYNGRLQREGRALLDSGSVPPLITDRLADQLRLVKTPCLRSFTCASGNILSSQNKVTVNLTPTSKDLPDESVICHVVKKLPTIIAPDTPATVLGHLSQRGRSPFADPTLGGDMDVLLGVTDSSRCHRGPREYTNDNAGYAVPTVFGWVLGGRLPGAPTNQTVLFVQPAKKSQDEALQRLWDMDQVPFSEQKMSKDETRAVEHFQDTHQRNPADGRFFVRLPRKEPPPPLGHSKSTAIRRFLRNEKSLKVKGQLEQFEKGMKEYFTLDHAEVVPKSQLKKPDNQLYYVLPCTRSGEGIIDNDKVEGSLRRFM